MAKELQISYREKSGTGIFNGGEHINQEESPSESVLTFTSWIREIDFAYAGLDLVCLTSLNEGTPVSLIEAQASGRAVVSTKVGGVENIVQHEKTGLLSELSLKKFSENLIRLVDNHEERTAMGQEGVNQVVTKYNYQRLVKETSQLYTDLLPSDQKRR
ncbi:MAG: glycosyltransferase family 4 protein [Flavobacteriales bacterium]|nr:glycosyltransferase family 4 protein [Flavobacteriales bacterium]